MNPHNNLTASGGQTSQLSEGELLAIEIATRTSSVFSVLGSTFIVASFLCFKIFRKPINRLVFYASFGNLLANVATLMSRSGIPKGNGLTGLCEFQGVLIQWFMMADSLWVFSMATNVFLVFFHGYNSHQLHKLEKYYFLLAYGIPAIPALTYVILDHTSRIIIGPATLWCWVGKSSDWMRITFFYGPVWVIVSATLTIYVVTGLKIYKQRSHLRSFSHHSISHIRPSARNSIRVEERLAKKTPVDNKIVVTTQIKHDVRPSSSSQADSRAPSPERDHVSVRSMSTQNPSSERATEDASPAPAILAHQEFRATKGVQNDVDVQSCYKATAFVTTTAQGAVAFRPDSSRANRPHKSKPVEGHDAAMAYFKVAFLMFVALFVVWVPSSVNRLYQFTHDNDPNFPLNFISAIVLPMQGIWNATIYIFTTRPECRRAYRIIRSKTNKEALVEQHNSNESPMGTITSGRSQESDLELALEPTYKTQDPRRHSEMSHPDSMVDSKPFHPLGTP